jgi:uncharacterized protein (DUF58 family)
VTDASATGLSGQWVRRPTTRGASAAVLGIGLLAAGAAWRYPSVLMLGGALVILAGAAAASVLRRAPVEVQRRVWPLEVTRFEACEATLRIERQGGLLPLSVDTIEYIGGAPVPIMAPPLRARRGAVVRYPIPTQRRGVVTVGPLEVQRRALGGLAENRAALGTTLEVRVLPRVLPVGGLPSGVRRVHVGTDERVPYGGTDLIGLREYLAGDDLRRLHWATSARAGKPMVREDADPSSAQLTLLLDDRADSYVDPADMEEAVEVVASLAVAAASAEHSVHLLTVCEQVEYSVLAAPGVPVDARDLVSVLAGVSLLSRQAEPAPLPLASLDVVVVITGAGAEAGPLVTEAGRSALGVVAVVDQSAVAARTVVTAGGVTVLRGGRAVDLLRRWDDAVVG